MLVGTRVLARREDDLEAEEGIIKKLHSVGGATVANVRLLDGYMVPNVPVEELVAVKADVAAAASRPQGGELSFDTDTEYDETVGPQLPEPPAEPQGEAKYAWAAAYKEVGNGLFKQGKHEWALRTYLNGVQQLHRLGYADDPERMFTDVAAWSVCAASFSNAALCALKLGRYELAVQCCDRGLRFAVSDAERAKLQARKGQALLERPQHADPDEAVQLLQRAHEAQSSRAVLELLHRAKRAAKEKQREADRALFGGKGLSASLAQRGVDASDRADAARECEVWMREGVAHLLGVSPSREFVEHKYRDMAEITGGEPYVPAQVDSVAASAAFVRVEARAREVALRAERAHAIFGLAAAAADREAWPEAARGFVLYFKLADEAAAAGEPFEPPLLGTAYARFHAGMAEYQMRHAPPALEHLQGYLDAVAAFKEVDIYTADSFGGKTYTDYDRELQRQRQWIVSGRCEHNVRRMLVSVHEVLATEATDNAAAGAALQGAIEHAEAALRLSWEEEQRQEAHETLAKLFSAIGLTDKAQEHEGAAGTLAQAVRSRVEERAARRAAAEQASAVGIAAAQQAMEAATMEAVPPSAEE